MTDRRKHVSFKNNVMDNMLLKWAEDQSQIYGFSSYIKKLIENDMKSSLKVGDNCDSNKTGK